MGIRDRLVDPRSPDRRPRRAAYALPTLFTAYVFLGFVAILRCIRAATLNAGGQPGVSENFALAAKFIGAAVFLDGLDGYIARLTNTTSDFGREMDSLADVISFGLAPGILAFTWGVQFADVSLPHQLQGFLRDTGAFFSFLFLLCGAVRLARFNVQKNPVPKNPGRPDRKYFVGMPIPAGAAMVAATVYAFGAEPLNWWPLTVLWLLLLGLLGFLMVSTWRYYSFKGLKLDKARSPLILIVLGAFIYGTWNYGQPLLLAMAASYVASGIVIRAGGSSAAVSTTYLHLPLRSIKLADTIALVGSESLLGREIRDIVATSSPGFELRLIAADGEQAGRLTRVGDEPATVTALSVVNLTGARAVVLAASPDASRKALQLASEADPDGAIVDLTFVAEDRPNARLRAPLVEAQSEIDEFEAAESPIHVIAHPAAIALALFLRRLHAHDPVRRSVIQIFAPASEHGATGVEELQNQTISLLSFKPLPHAVFDTQLSFNLLPRYGEEAPAPLEETELRIERHLASLLAIPGEGEGAPMPSLRTIQAPVFHGYSFSIWVEFDDDTSTESIESSLAAAHIEVRGREFEPPNHVSQAGQGGIAVGAIAPDRNAPEAFWFWMVADNFRLAAENAVAVVRELL